VAGLGWVMVPLAAFLTVALPDAYRAVLLGELGLMIGLYGWSLGHYVFDNRFVTDPGLRVLRRGAACRVAGVLIIFVIVLVAVIAAFGRPDIGRTIFNLLLQVALLFLFIGWLLVDRVRFTSPPENDVALRAVARMHQVSRRLGSDPGG
jgi:hypothetical protein